MLVSRTHQLYSNSSFAYKIPSSYQEGWNKLGKILFTSTNSSMFGIEYCSPKCFHIPHIFTSITIYFLPIQQSPVSNVYTALLYNFPSFPVIFLREIPLFPGLNPSRTKCVYSRRSCFTFPNVIIYVCSALRWKFYLCLPSDGDGRRDL